MLGNRTAQAARRAYAPPIADPADPAITIDAILEDLVSDTSKLLDAFERAVRHLAAGDRQSACNAVALSHDALDYVREGREELLRRLETMGFVPAATKRG